LESVSTANKALSTCSLNKPY